MHSSTDTLLVSGARFSYRRGEPALDGLTATVSDVKPQLP